jgi:hypothetical protein
MTSWPSRNGIREGGSKMGVVHVFSLKVGTAHGVWQYKLSGTHDKVMMHSLRHILNKTCQFLGFDYSDRSVVYLFHFSAEPFEGCQICLERMREARDGVGVGCYYRVKQSSISNFKAEGLFPAFVNSSYLRTWPERIYFRLEKSITGGIVN